VDPVVAFIVLSKPKNVSIELPLPLVVVTNDANPTWELQVHRSSSPALVGVSALNGHPRISSELLPA
jgi:hypothetical protein